MEASGIREIIYPRLYNLEYSMPRIYQGLAIAKPCGLNFAKIWLALPRSYQARSYGFMGESRAPNPTEVVCDCRLRIETEPGLKEMPYTKKVKYNICQLPRLSDLQ